jgi:hypothetical protein
VEEVDVDAQVAWDGRSLPQVEQGCVVVAGGAGKSLGRKCAEKAKERTIIVTVT